MAGECQRDWEGYDSSFEDEVSEPSAKKNLGATSKQQNSKTLLQKSNPASDLNLPGTSSCHTSGLPSKRTIDDVARRTESYKNSFLNLNAFERHKKLVQDYLLYFPKSTKLLYRDATKDKTDSDIIRENHRLLWKSESEADTWEKQLAKKYHDKLFKEYGICDLTYWKDNKVGIRWRTEEELQKGKGQFSCGTKKCESDENLRTWEVNFVYIEESQKKNTLVKLRLCPSCSTKLNYRRQRKEVTKRPKVRKNRSSGAPKEKKRKGNEEESQTTEEISSNETEESNIWKGPAIIPESKSRGEEYDEYLDDLLL